LNKHERISLTLTDEKADKKLQIRGSIEVGLEWLITSVITSDEAQVTYLTFGRLRPSLSNGLRLSRHPSGQAEFACRPSRLCYCLLKHFQKKKIYIYIYILCLGNVLKEMR
jgi:hypothetical protein